MQPPVVGQTMTIAQARRALAAAFRERNIDSPDLDARLLVGHALGLDHAALASASSRGLDEAQAAAIAAFAERRVAGEPVARIIGVKEFWGLPLRLNAATLVPRPETETLVETALDLIDAGGPRSRTLRVADLGTGSGALLLALLSELPGARGIATDISVPALAAAHDNAQRLGFAERAGFVACDFGAALVGGFDLVVVNPPYIASRDIAGLPPEVRHDPHLALDGAADGLACYRTLAADAKRLIAPDGHIVVELGAGQEAAVTALLQTAGLAPTGTRPDLSGIPRALTARVATLPP